MIVGFTINGITAKRNDGVSVRGKEINVTTNPTITEIKLIDVLGKKDALRAKYVFKCEYEPRIGEISFEGDVLWKGNSEKETHHVAELWDKETKFEPAAATETMNTILRRCLTRAIGLADELRLPPPLQFPIVTTKEEKTEQQDIG
ncbi:MAG: hypothetical protein HYW25_02360 [Candidatus Aenigmarchaeota archaeon]|nr:hypothetical protein [Candidatus Aenigmarchaeota archaeon]